MVSHSKFNARPQPMNAGAALLLPVCVRGKYHRRRNRKPRNVGMAVTCTDQHHVTGENVDMASFCREAARIPLLGR